MGSIGRWWLVLVLASLLLPPAAAAAPRSPAATGQFQAAPVGGASYFPETGFWVEGPFLAFWQEHGGLMTFGYPISRVFYQDGLHRQYFERAIFEHHGDLAGTPYEVLLTRLGALRTTDRWGDDPFRPVRAAADESCDVYPETGHRLCNGFRDYWRAHGGLPSFGYPISEEFVEGGHTVQYFERARFEYHPEYRGTPYEVLLGHLGWEALRARPVPGEATTPEEPGASPAPPLGPRPLYNHDVGCGFNMFWWGEDENLPVNEYYLDRVRDAGCQWIRIQGQWQLLEPEPGIYILHPLERVIDAARERGLKVLVSVNTAPAWALTHERGIPADPERFGEFMAFIASFFRGRVDAWQIWNEPNYAPEAGGYVDPSGYLALLRRAYPAVKAADPDALVVLAGMAPSSLVEPTLIVDDARYVETLLALNGGEARDYFDVAGMHSYGAGNSPDNYWPDNPADAPGWTGAPEFYFRHAEEMHNILVAAGLGDVPVWLTEFGWTTKNDWPAWGFGDWVTEEDKARYLTRAFEIARTEWPWMQNMFVWNLNYAAITEPGHPHATFSVLDAEGQPRPSYEAIAELFGGAEGQ